MLHQFILCTQPIYSAILRKLMFLTFEKIYIHKSIHCHTRTRLAAVFIYNSYAHSQYVCEEFLNTKIRDSCCIPVAKALLHEYIA